jgi:DNA-directed RNA polymerase alpha subunit
MKKIGDNLSLSLQTYRLLEESGITTLDELMQLSDADFLKLKGITKKRLWEIRIALVDYYRGNAFKSY